MRFLASFFIAVTLYGGVSVAEEVPQSVDALRQEASALLSGKTILSDNSAIDPAVLSVDVTRSFAEQVGAHKDNLRLLKELDALLENAFEYSDSAQVVRAATVARDSMLPFIFVYNLSAERAKLLAADGYLLKNIHDPANVKTVAVAEGGENGTSVANASASTGGSGLVAVACNSGECAQVDPIVALFMIAINAIAQEFEKEHPFGENNTLTIVYQAAMEFLAQPAGGPDSAFVKARSVLIPQDDQGEVARILRDPIRRPMEIIEEGLKFLNEDNGIVAQALTQPGNVIFNGWDPRPDDNGEISKAIRDPVKCTVGHLWGGCD